MIQRRPVLTALLCAGLAIGCASAPSPTAPVRPSAPPSDAPSSTVSATQGPSPSPEDTIPTVGDDEMLDAGTYRLDRSVVGEKFPPITLTVPDGWHGGGWLVNRPRGDQIPPVSVQFWDVQSVYGHPCQSSGTLFLPGPTVEDVAQALVDVPLRNATQPIDVTLDGYAGKYLEWSVPADIEQDAEGNFTDCDLAADGNGYFDSWTGKGAASGRYQQGPGQLDRVWIIDVDGSRLVIDAFSMPYATSDEIEELEEVVKSIRIER